MYKFNKKIESLPDKSIFLKNFVKCNNWEEKYMYIIELGNCLLPFPNELRIKKNLVSGCQSQVWIVIVNDSYRYFQLYGDSDSSIVKGLIATIFIFYQEMNLKEIIMIDIYPFFYQLSFDKHLTSSRVHGLGSIIKAVQTQASLFIQKKKN